MLGHMNTVFLQIWKKELWCCSPHSQQCYVGLSSVNFCEQQTWWWKFDVAL